MNKLCKRLGLALALFMALTLSACGGDAPGQGGRPDVAPDLLSQEPQSSVTVYFPSADSDTLTPLSYGINSSRDTIWIALEKLLAGPPDSFCRQALPQGVKLSDLYYADGVVNISLQGDAPLTLDDVDLDAFYATVNDELLEQDGTTAAILLSYNGQALLEEPYSFDYLNDYSNGKGGSYVYYADGQAMYLVPLTLPISRDDHAGDDALFDYLAALVAAWSDAPPKGSGLYSALPEGVAATAAAYADGALTIDFGAELLETGGSAQERLLVDSLLATFANVDEVDTLYITIDGQPVELLPHGTEVAAGLAVEHEDFSFNQVNNLAVQ